MPVPLSRDIIFSRIEKLTSDEYVKDNDGRVGDVVFKEQDINKTTDTLAKLLRTIFVQNVV